MKPLPGGARTQAKALSGNCQERGSRRVYLGIGFPGFSGPGRVMDAGQNAYATCGQRGCVNRGLHFELLAALLERGWLYRNYRESLHGARTQGRKPSPETARNAARAACTSASAFLDFRDPEGSWMQAKTRTLQSRTA